MYLSNWKFSKVEGKCVNKRVVRNKVGEVGKDIICFL